MTGLRAHLAYYAAGLLSMSVVMATVLMQTLGMPWQWPHGAGWAWLTLSVSFGLILGFAEDTARVRPDRRLERTRP